MKETDSRAPLRAEHGEERIAIYRDGASAALLTQNAAKNHRPYIHPILAPDGIGELTEDEPGHHVWQHGLYTGLNDVNGVGFWTEGRLPANREHDGTFHPHPLAPPVAEGNCVRWSVTTDWRSPGGGELMLTETQTWVLEDRSDLLALDLSWELHGAETDLRFGKYSYGGLFLRMPWRTETGCALLTSEGAASPRDAEGKRARWIALAMPIPGRAAAAGPAGIAILDHPSNPEHPVPWRLDNTYGITPSRCIAGEWWLARDAVTVSSYRVFVYTGDISRDAIEAEWQQFAAAASGKTVR